MGTQQGMGWRAASVCLVALTLGPALGWSVVHSAEGGAAEAVATAIEVEKTLLEEDLVSYEELARRRSEAAARLTQLYQSLDATMKQREAGVAERLNQLQHELERAEIDRGGQLNSERVLLDRVRDRLRRIALLEEELGKLQGRQEKEVAGALSGSWDLVLLPLQQRGSCVLEQKGTLVNGIYELEGGWTGSLQGTLINRKVFLHRIDSKLGKSMELQGYLSADGKSIRGTWLNYELAGAEGSTGHWSAQRRTSQPAAPVRSQ